MDLVAGCVMEGSMVFCQKNILKHSMRFHGDYKEMYTNTQGQSDILIHKTNIWYKVYLGKHTFFYNFLLLWDIWWSKL